MTLIIKMPSCILRYCTNYSTKTKKCTQGITFHKFPRPGHDIREVWLRFVQNNRREEFWHPSKHASICSEHFREQDYYMTKTGRRYLKKAAVPMENPKEVIVNPKAIENFQQSISPATLFISEDISDEHCNVVLKEQLQDTASKNNILIEENKKLRHQCRYLKLRNRKLTDTIKSFKLLIGKSLQYKQQDISVVQDTSHYSTTKWREKNL